MRRQTELNNEFQNIHNANELSKIHNNTRDTYYKGIKISFLEGLFGEDYREIFDNAWGNKKDFMKEYKVDYAEWNEFEK